MSKRLNERVTVQRSSTVSDGAGGRTVTWAESSKQWAHVRAVRGKEEERLGRVVGVETYVVTMRYGIDVLASDRLIWDTKTLQISGPAQDRDGNKRYLTLECQVGSGT